MATEGEVRFLRSSYLLLKGTFYLVKKVLLREAEKERQETGSDLDGLLKDYEQQLKHQFRHKKHREKLFTLSGKTDVENWDISLLTGVLLIVFQKSLPDEDRKAIKEIKNERNDIYAHCHEASLNEVDYTDTCNKLKKAFNTLASGCSAAVEQECDDIIQTCLNGALDCKSHVELLIQLAEKDNMLVEIIAKIKPNELRERVLKALQQALQGQRRIEVKVVDSHLGICGTDEDEDNIALAENIIVTVINEAIRREQTCEENTCIREIIQEILDEITSQTGVKPISADKGCVIIRFDCCSNEQLFQFIIYMESKDMKERLNKLADSLSRLLNTKEKLQVSFSLSLETMKSILDEITPKVQREYKRSVHIPIQIESVEGIKRVFDLFEGGGLTNNLQKLSEALTEKVGAQINVKTSINMKQLKEALEDFEVPARQIGKTEECRSGEGATGHKGELYVNAEEGGDESTQINLTEDIYVEREEPEEQSIQEKPSEHEEDIYVEREEPEEQSIQEKPSDHEEDINMEREEPEEQSIQEKPSEHKEDIYVERGEPEEQSSQEKPSDHEEDINMEREEPEEQSIQEKPSDHEEEIYVDAKEHEEQNIQKKPTDHEEEIYVDAKEPEEQNIQKKPTDHEEEIYVDAKEPEEQNIQKKPTDHEEEIYVDAKEPEEQNIQKKPTDHEEEIYVDAKEPEEQNIQKKPTDHEEEIYVDAKEPEEQNIQKKPTDHEEEIYVDAKEPEEQNIQKKPTEIVLSNRECLFRLQNLVIDVGTDVSRNIFEKRLQGMALEAFLADQLENINKFKQKKAITNAQYNLLYPPGGQPPCIAEFDITLILCLLKYLPFYESIRQQLPDSVENDLFRMYTITSEIARISLLGGFQQLSFHTIKTGIEEVLLSLDATAPKPLSNLSERIKRYENKTLDPAAERKNQKIFNQWWQMELRLSPLRPRRPNMSIVPMKEKKYIKTDLKSIKAEDETSTQKSNAKDESSDESSEEDETKVTLWSLVQNQQCVFRLQSLVIDVGTDVLRNIFDQRLQGLALEALLANEMENLKDLKQQRVITNAQFNLLYPPGGQPSNIAEFDITLILCLLRHLPSLRFNDFYKCAQRQMPDDVSVEDDIHRLCDIMNEIVRSSWSGRFHQPSFHTIKTEIEEVLLRLNKTVPKPLANLNERIKRYENKTLDPAAKKRNQKLFNQWEEMELTPVIPLRPIRTTVPKKRQDFGDINQQITMQNVRKIDTIGGFRSVMKNKQYIEQDVTSIKKDIKSLEADLKSIKGEEIEHGVSKGNEAESTYRQMKSDHEEDIFTEREEPEEQSIKENPSDETSTQKSNAKDESSDESSEENETEEILWNLVQNQNTVSRLQSLVIDVGTDVLRNILDHRLMHGLALDDFLTNEMENIKSLKQQKAITNAQFSLLCPPDGQPSNIAEFDITLILCLLIHLPSLRFNDFNKCTQRPMPAGVSGGTDIHRLCDIMNKIDSLSWNVMFNQSSFNTIKTEIEEVLLRLNKTVPKPLANLNERIKTYENKPLDHTAERRNKKIFDQWEFVWCGRLEPLERNRTIVTTMRQDFGDINPQVTIQNVNKIDMIGEFRSVMEEEQYVKQDVTSIKKEFRSIEADLKSIKTKDIEHGVSKGNEAESA